MTATKTTRLTSRPAFKGRVRPPSKPPTPCVICYRDRVWAAGQYPGTYEARCVGCEDLAEEVVNPGGRDRHPTDDDGGGLRALYGIVDTCEGLTRKIGRFESAHRMPCRCPVCRDLAISKGNVLELLSMIRTTAHRAGFLIHAVLPTNLVVVGDESEREEAL